MGSTPRNGYVVSLVYALLFASCSWGMLTETSRAYEYVFSDFNGTGLGYTFRDFQQDVGLNSVRLYDPVDGAGGGGLYLGDGLDFSDFASSPVEVDFTVNPPSPGDPLNPAGNAAREFQFQLIDINDNRADWIIDLQSLTPGVPQTLLTSTTLGNPENTSGAFDLTQVKQFQIVGDYGSAIGSFDVSFDRIAIENDLPYRGAPDQAWRDQAATNIHQFRKADLTIHVTDALGNPLAGATVDVAMQRHEFTFGTAVATPWINATGADADTYRQTLLDMFNHATTENALKWQPWALEYDLNRWNEQLTLDALDWLANNNLPTRGHNLFWPGEEWLPSHVLAAIDPLLQGGQLTAMQQSTLRTIISDHIEDIVAKTAGKVVSWDIVNEPRVNDLLMEALDEGDLAMVDWFNQTQSVLAANNASAKLFLNEFGILTSAGETDTAAQQQYLDHIQLLLDQGAPIEGIGLQGHFQEHNISGPAELWQILDRYEALGLDIEVTEFDLTTTDRTLQAEFLTDFLTAMFAHEGVDGVTQWGFWAGSHPRPDAALFDLDWTIRPNGQAYLDLVFGEWWTEEQLLADQQGDASLSGFKGEYLVTVQLGDELIALPATLTEGGLTLNVQLDILPGDFNGDTQVDLADYAVWRNRLGATVIEYTAGDADGDGVVTAADYNIWKQNFGVSLNNTLSTAPVPEPPMCVFAAMALTLAWIFRRSLKQTNVA